MGLINFFSPEKEGGLNREFSESRLSIIVIVNNGFEPVENDICSF